MNVNKNQKDSQIDDEDDESQQEKTPKPSKKKTKNKLLGKRIKRNPSLSQSPPIESDDSPQTKIDKKKLSRPKPKKAKLS